MHLQNAPLKLGIIGAGAAARTLHVPALHSLQASIDVTAVTDIDPNRAREVQGRFARCQLFATPDELIGSPAVSTVAILTPPASHAALALAAMRDGKHVFVEKPLTTTVDDALTLVRAAAESGVRTAVGHNLRFHRFVRQARELIGNGAIGELIALTTVWNARADGQPGWRRDREQGGGVLFDLGVHHFDLARYLTGSEFEYLTATTRSEGDDDLAASVSGRTAHGVLFSAIWSKVGGESHCIRLSGTKAAVEFSFYRANSWRVSPAGLVGLKAYADEARQYAVQLPAVFRAMRSGGDMAASYRGEWRDFAAAVASGRDPLCSFKQVWRSIEACRRIAPVSAPSQAQATPEDVPVLSVILSVKGDWELARRTVRHLRAQSLRNEMELILVAVSSSRLQAPESDLAGFRNCKVVTVAPDASVAQANAAGVRAASSKLVAFAEDHCFPESGWAAALVNAHARGHAAVGPEIANANPGSVVSWCDYLVGYGPWISPCAAGQVPFLPGHNSSYKREVLLQYGGRLEALLEAEAVLHFDLVRQGHTLYLEPAARAAHVNFARWGVWIPVQYHCGRLFAGSRASSWNLARKLFYGAASPLIPLVRAARIYGELLKPNRPRHRIARVLPALLAGLAVDGLGQMIGYLAGPGQSPARLADYEHDRLRFVRPADHRALEELDVRLGG